MRSFGERVEEEHGKLAPLFVEALDALAGAPDPEAPSESVERLGAAIVAHLAHEDQVYYPALWTLRPEHRGDLERFVAFHRRFRADFEEIVRLARHDPAAAAERLRAFSQSFAKHEVREEEFLRKIEAESPPEQLRTGIS